MRALLPARPGSSPDDPDQPRRPDAVTALLGQIWDDALDPGYAAAAAARARGEGRTRSRTRRRLGAALALALAGVLLAAAAVQANAARPAVATQRADLVQRINEQTATNDRAVAAVAAAAAAVDRLRAVQLSAAGSGAALTAETDRLALAVGSVAVSGPGLTVTMSDAVVPGPATGGNTALGRVLDTDVQSVVNGLWAAGAEGVSINGHRLTATSAIRSAGDAILVDYRPLVPPYVISAIGDPKTFQSVFVASAAGRALVALQQQYGIAERVDAVATVTLPAAPVPDLRYATPVGGSS